MRTLLFVILAAISGAVAHADNVECKNVSGSVVMLYKPAPQAFHFITLNGTALGQPDIKAITGKIDDRPGLTPDYIVFSYPISDNRTVELTWISAETEIMRGLRGQPISGVVKQGQAVTETFPACGWTTRE